MTLENKYINKVFANIKILSTSGKVTEKCLAKCLLCDKEWHPRLDGVVYGKIKSCGCLKTTKKNYVGRIFNGIEILKQFGGAADYSICLCHCGIEWEVRLHSVISGDAKSCGCVKYKTGREHPLWKGGHLVKKSGYVVITSNSKKIFEHRLVMQNFLGRELFPNEYVHHKNGIRHDNRLENLELWITSQPKGQRPKDLVSWAKQIIELYGKLC